jgi:drug/metabolite transporter (DMT)-like permease
MLFFLFKNCVRRAAHEVRTGLTGVLLHGLLVDAGVSMASSSKVGFILLVWFATSTIFNDVTPRLMKILMGSGGDNMDVTVIELAITLAIAVSKLRFEGSRVVPPNSLLSGLFCVGGFHLAGCRAFIWGLQFIPVAIAQTIRAANPVVTVAFGTLFFGEALPSLSILSCLLPLVVGFAVAVSGGASDVAPVGVVAAIFSVSCLTIVNRQSKKMLSVAKEAVLPGEIQCWICAAALFLLFPFWAFSGGPARLATAFTGPNSSTISLLCCADGALYFSEQLAQFAAITLLSPLTLAVVDTTRRVFIVVVAGFVLQGDAVTPQRVVGALIVYAGAALYAYMSCSQAEFTSLWVSESASSEISSPRSSARLATPTPAKLKAA